MVLFPRAAALAKATGSLSWRLPRSLSPLCLRGRLRGQRLCSSEAATSAISSAEELPPLSAQQLASWTPESAKDLLEQVAFDGQATLELLQRLRANSKAASGPSPKSMEAAEGEETAEDALVESDDSMLYEMQDCSHPEMVRVAELCAELRVRDFMLLSLLSERLVPSVSSMSVDGLLGLGSTYSKLGALSHPLFDEIATAFLQAWPKESSTVTCSQIVDCARAFSVQRMRHEPLFERLGDLLRSLDVSKAATPGDAVSLLHSVAFLRLDNEIGDLWGQLEKAAVQPGFKEMSVMSLAELAYIIFLARRDTEKLSDLIKMLEAMCAKLPGSEDVFWSTAEDAPALQRRVLLLRSAMRYLHRDAHKSLSQDAQDAFRMVHRMEPPTRVLKPTRNFIRKLSHTLTKLRIGHICEAERGAFVLDVVERDRKLVYECNHFDRFYANSIQKIASMCLQERIVKAMGYRVVQVPHWQWIKIRHKRQRSEYIRMSRYYAIKDRREFSPREDSVDDIGENEFEHLGEYFFKKELPSKHWSWFSPKYEASRRIPESSASP
eukprot:TRINITY_DN5705_c0_g1_i1.p1 TRINITY_DN5705_c0_g1~~TRINITY_DN5705_c0_g1_i1.p1  ORF type:complete len:551 (+),score=99.64 TRINITY_DN5705_c0_g1_i1:123-1775(+)